MHTATGIPLSATPLSRELFPSGLLYLSELIPTAEDINELIDSMDERDRRRILWKLRWEGDRRKRMR